MIKKIIFFGVLSALGLITLTVYQQRKFNDGLLHVIFCDVGQGDGIYIRTPNGANIIIDAGPDNSILTCLKNHSPFWDRQIELMILSHPHLDHFFGMNYILDSYQVMSFATEELSNSAGSFKTLINKISEHKVPRKFVGVGDKWNIGDGVNIVVEAPTTEFLHQTSPNGLIGESHEFGSLITHINYGTFDVLLTGDSQAESVSQVVKQIDGKLEVLQVPHHGSATGLSDVILNISQPNLAVISVGHKNRYGHPKASILQLLKDHGIKTLRTDEHGDIEIVTDGKSYEVK